MSEKRTERLLKIARLIAAAAVIVCACALMAACIGIYRSGAHPYSREAVAQAFAPIRPIVYVCVAICLAATLMHLFAPNDRAFATRRSKNHSRRSQQPPAREPKRHAVHAVRLALLCVAIALVILGVVSGGIADVLAKAINICTECVGLG